MSSTKSKSKYIKCDKTRSVSLCIFLLNFNMHMNYFPQHFVPNIIQTEGIIPNFLGLDTSRYLHFLGVLRENIENNTIRKFLKNNFKHTNDISPQNNK
jgi:hypothetical protein